MKRNKKGFTLAELLIVVAIIAVLVAIAIPIFTSSLHSSQEATDEANCRSYYADLQADYLANMNGTYTATTADKATSFKLSDGEEITLSANSTVDVSFTDGQGYTVTWTCSKEGNTKTWGAQPTSSSTTNP